MSTQEAHWHNWEQYTTHATVASLFSELFMFLNPMRMGDLLQEVSLIIKYPVNLHIGMIWELWLSDYLILAEQNAEI